MEDYKTIHTKNLKIGDEVYDIPPIYPNSIKFTVVELDDFMIKFKCDTKHPYAENVDSLIEFPLTCFYTNV